MSSEVTQFSIHELLYNEDQYVIPMYQRNYAWEEDEIFQLIQDIIDKLMEDSGEAVPNYYIGTLVVDYRRNGDSPTGRFETIDGQQRLTTLLLLVASLKKLGIEAGKIPAGKLQFNCREKSSHTLDVIVQGNFRKRPEELLDSSRINPAILNGYQLIAKNLPLKLREHDKTESQFTEFLFDRVKIIRVRVPEGTDLNHYFEIMNSRGEQLEKHEVLKAELLGALEPLENKEECQECLHAVWEACSNMEKYVQMGFKTEYRRAIFGSDWSSFIPADFTELSCHFKPTQGVTDSREKGSELPRRDPNSLAAIIDNGTADLKGRDQQGRRDQETPDRFHPVVNFPNFLLHVLRIMTEKDLRLDDKELIRIFREQLISKGSEEVKRFIYQLLRCKWLFDNYIIKREFIEGGDHWSLKQLKCSESGNVSYINTFGEEGSAGYIDRRWLMLLSAFHVSSPTMVYKHWLNGALRFLSRSAAPIAGDKYLRFLESLARAFVFQRFLTSGEKRSYFEIIYGDPENEGPTEYEIPDEKLSFGNIENNLVFNYLDYLLWLPRKTEKSFQSYEFTFRSSQEHHFPQHPGFAHGIPSETLNSFGNLCLVSHSRNSQLGNKLPEQKKQYYQGKSGMKADSVKQYLMMESEAVWNTERIIQHHLDMKAVLLRNHKESQDPL
jgi:hypothetical protein